MTSTHTKTLARAIQRANPGMKYTAALRHAEAGHIVVDPKGPVDGLRDMYQAAGANPLGPDLPSRDGSPSDGRNALDPQQSAVPASSRPDTPDEGEWGVASDPTAWDGQPCPSIFTFLAGTNLRTGEDTYLSLDRARPNLLVTGVTGSGKTRFVETLMAQALATPMPWDASLSSTVVILDPTGHDLAPRWAGRPGVVVANGGEGSAQPRDNGDPVSGATVMARAMEWIQAEYQRRASILAQHATAASWLDLPDEVKCAEGLAPMLVVLDNYEVIATLEPSGGDALIEHNNEMRGEVTALADQQARRYGHAGIHTVLTSMRPTPRAVNLSNFLVRVVMREPAEAPFRMMFGERSIPRFPSGASTVGCARVATDGDSKVQAVRVPALGGATEMGTLDRWFPRGAAPGNGDFSLPTGKPRARGAEEG